MAGHIAVIGGTGFETLPPEIFAERLDVAIDLDAASGSVPVWSISDNYVEPYKLYFLSRHGADHGLAPHQIDYRANIAALSALGVRYVYGVNAVGSLRRELHPGALVLLDDFIDFTRHRPLTFYGERNWAHTDFSKPYSERLRASVIEAARRLEVSLVERGTYLCCDGPRFESPAEIRMFAQWGADVVGMTGLPEAIFAREAGLEYAGLSIVTNLGAGLSENGVDHTEVVTAMRSLLPMTRELLLAAGGVLIEGLLRSQA